MLRSRVLKSSHKQQLQHGGDISGDNGDTTTRPGGAGVREMGYDSDSGDEVGGTIRADSGIINIGVDSATNAMFDAHMLCQTLSCGKDT